MTINLRISITLRLAILAVAMLFTGVFPLNAVAVQDILLQTLNGRIATGIVDDQSGMGTLEQRVYGGHFQLVSGNFRASNPGFFGLRSGDANMPSGASGFPSQHDVSFDLLPMSIGLVSSNLFYWDGSDVNGGGIDLTDVDFIVPTDVYWDVFDANFAPSTVSGADQLVSGGLIQRTSTDIWPDGIDSGTIHKHLALQVRDNDGNPDTAAPAGVYLISWQVRSAGFETSKPFFFVHRTPMISDAVRDVAVAWVEDNIEMLTSPPQLPGDYNGDGSVDAADYVVWRKTFGQTELLLADGNRNEEIDAGDYTGWSEGFGEWQPPGKAGSEGVPEPATCALLLLGSIALFPRSGPFGQCYSNCRDDRLYSTKVLSLSMLRR